MEGRRGRTEALDSKKELFKLEESHNKPSHTDRDHVPCAALGINKKALKFKFETAVKRPWAAKCVWL